MKVITLVLFWLLLTLPAFSQPAPSGQPAVKKAELISPWISQGTKVVYNEANRGQSCLDLVRFEAFCSGAETISYGNRVGKNWDIFQISGGRDSQTRMIDLGARDWNDKFTIPEIEPWEALKPGETRHITINASGADGAPGARGKDGADGRNGADADGTVAPAIPSTKTRSETAKKASVDYANASLERQVTSAISMSGKVPRTSSYSPVMEAKLGHMYLIRVVDAKSDHYVLMRVDNIARGVKASISYFSFSPPAPL